MNADPGTIVSPPPNQNNPSTENSFSWETHPAAQKPALAGIGIGLIGFVTGAVFQLTGEWIYCAIALIILLVASAPFFQKTRYQINDVEVTRTMMGMTRKLMWKEVKRYTKSAGGIFISPLKKECWNDRHGIYLMFGNKREEILAKVEAHLDKI
jgi:hypothetical protein